MSSPASTLDDLGDDFGLYLASRMGVSEAAALCRLGDWLLAFKTQAHVPALGSTVVSLLPGQDLPPSLDGKQTP